MLRADNLELAVPGRVLCQGVNVALQPGECWVVLGQNGSGKTTLLHALSGLGIPQGGRVTLRGRPLESFPRRALAREIGVLLQEEAQAFWGTVLEYVLLGGFARSGWRGPGRAERDTALQALEQVDLAAAAGRRLNTLSGGERQRARLAMLLVQSPQIFFLDEPLRHLDLRHQLETLELLRGLASQGRTVLMALHELQWADRYSDGAILLYGEGRVASGASVELLNRPNLEQLYGCSLAQAAFGRQDLPRV